MRLSVDVSARFTAPGAEPFDVAVDLAVETGETLVVLGPSGSGKTLLLETVAGYHRHEGTVHVGDRDVTDEPPEARGLGFVFQNYALFPHLTVRENVAFGRRYHPDARDPDEVLADLDIVELAERTPETLSGGEAQRVALARSLAIRPDTLLLDEPLSALDVPTRESLRVDLGEILADVTALYVTHNRTTARALGDRIAVMRAGRVVQLDEPDAIFDRPATPFVARFTGSNCLPVPVWAGAVDGGGDAPAAEPPRGRDDGATMAIRPEYVVLGEGGVSATVDRVVREDLGHRVALARDGSTVEAHVTRAPTPGAETTVRFPARRVTWFDQDDEPV